ncbi:NAD(+) diphosphatase [Alteromonas aestuariivivens]|uniref:NAD(+) diphosphatase n=1 Tax=Alteromonas aestuariivivens TaxID=1938339 RepID=A0A3D8M7B6_9ALTE|nr:NAD(+) diphosphatase [Alteromonas aestuariivivens]RDV25618.1 NAD(+) diphosphatase [Alteromonas aestuariivivens]
MNIVHESELAAGAGVWLIFSQGQLLLESGTTNLPKKHWHELPFLHHYRSDVRLLKPLVQQSSLPPCYVVDMGLETPRAQGWEEVSLRTAISTADSEQFETIARAWQYVHFLRTHRFCGKCGAATTQVDWEMAVQCHQCQHRCYPRISPCIIVAIVRGNTILLAKGVRHQSTNMYSTLAGFVESGESLEQAVHREVFEEVGIRVENLRYFSSQPWPFPHSLMMGFIADYKSGELRLEENEILDADWFEFGDLPNTPPKVSIAGQLIDAVINRQ